MGLGTRQKKHEVPLAGKQPFAEGEKRMLRLVVGSQESAFGSEAQARRVAGEKEKLTTPDVHRDEPPVTVLVEAEHKRTEQLPTHESRYYIIGIQGLGTGDLGLEKENQYPKPKSQAPVFVQLNHGDPAADEARLASITEDLLSVVENPQSEIRNLQSGGDPAADDEARLTAIAEDLLAEDRETGIQEYGETEKNGNLFEPEPQSRRPVILSSGNPVEGRDPSSAVVPKGLRRVEE